MPNMCIHIHGCDIESPETGRVRIHYAASAVDGNGVAGEVTLNFASSATAINSAIIDAAKAKHTAQLGTIFLPIDKFVLIGGVV